MSPGVDSASNNEYQGFSLGVKAASAWDWRPNTIVVPNIKKIRGLNLPGNPLGPCGLLWAWPLHLFSQTFISHRDFLLLFEWQIILSSLSKIFIIDHNIIFLSLASKMSSPYFMNGFTVDYVSHFRTCNWRQKRRESAINVIRHSRKSCVIFVQFWHEAEYA
jgi:hypothetical protein